MFTRLFDLFASALLANFQDRLVMTTSISLRKYDATARIIFTEFFAVGELSRLMHTAHFLGDFSSPVYSITDIAKCQEQKSKNKELDRNILSNRNISMSWLFETCDRSGRNDGSKSVKTGKKRKMLTNPIESDIMYRIMAFYTNGKGVISF